MATDPARITTPERTSEDADAALASMRSATLTPETRIVMLNSESWLAIDMGQLRSVAPRVDEMVGLLEAVDRMELWYHTTPPNRMPGLPGIGKALLRHAQALLRVAGDSSLSIRALAIVSQAWCALFEGRFADAAAIGAPRVEQILIDAVEHIIMCNAP